MVWVCSGTVAAYDYVGITVAAGSDDAIDDGSVFVVLVTRATIEDTGAHNSGGVGCPISSLKLAMRLLETGVSVISTEEL